jgi:hypothetical protein
MREAAPCDNAGFLVEAFGAACRRENVSLEARKSPRVRCIHIDGKQYRRGRIILPSPRGKRRNFPLPAIFAQQEVGLHRADSHTALLPGLSGDLRN